MALPAAGPSFLGPSGGRSARPHGFRCRRQGAGPPALQLAICADALALPASAAATRC